LLQQAHFGNISVLKIIKSYTIEHIAKNISFKTDIFSTPKNNFINYMRLLQNILKNTT